MKIYLDNSALNRPFDEQSNPKVHIESIAVLMILDFIDRRKIKLAVSSVSYFENENNPFLDKKNWIDYFITCDYDIIKRYKGSIKIADPVNFITLYNNENTR